MRVAGRASDGGRSSATRSTLPPASSVVYAWRPGEVVRVVAERGAIMTASPLEQVAEGGCCGLALYAKVATHLAADETPLPVIDDGYTAYNSITGELGRERGGCWSHARRGVFEILKHNTASLQPLIDNLSELFYFDGARQRA